MSITTRANDTYRDYETDGVPASGDHDPIKSDIRADWAYLDAVISTLEGVVTSGRKAYATYAALAASAAPAAGTVAEVPPGDTGQHNDPVVVGNPLVDNAGIYGYSTAPAGWERLYDYPPHVVASVAQIAAGTGGDLLVVAEALKEHLDDREVALTAVIKDATIIATVQTGTTSLITLTADGGHTPAGGSEYLFGFVATQTNLWGALLDVDTLTAGDAREFVLPDGSRIGASAIRPGAHTVVRYNTTTGKYVLVSPLPDGVYAIPTTVAADAMPYTLTRLPGFTTADGKDRYSFIAPSDRQSGEFLGVSFIVVGLNDGDARAAFYLNGVAVDQYAWRKGDVVIIEFVDEATSPITGKFAVLAPAQDIYAVTATDLSSFYAAASGRIYALNALGK